MKVFYYLQRDSPNRPAVPCQAKGEHVGSSATTGCRSDTLGESLWETAVIPLMAAMFRFADVPRLDQRRCAFNPREGGSIQSVFAVTLMTGVYKAALPPRARGTFRGEIVRARFDTEERANQRVDIHQAAAQ